eukprot:503270_1
MLFDACINGVDPPEDNTFSKILDRTLLADILYEDDAFMAFADHRPASQCHVLVIPKVGAVRSLHFLQPKHLDMLESMLAIAKQVIREEARLTANQQRTQARIGFNTFPTVNHRELKHANVAEGMLKGIVHFIPSQIPYLHLHAIAPVVKMKWWTKLLFWPDSLCFTTCETVITHLKQKQRASLII